MLRGTYLPGTVRCTYGHRLRHPSFSDGRSGGLLIFCFADVRVNAYLLGSGPSTLTVIVESSLYQTDITNSGVDDEDYGLEQLESRRLAYERALAEGGQFAYEEPLQGYLLPGGGIGQLHLDYRRVGPVVIGPIGGIGGKEAVLFIVPSNSLSVEAWRVFDTWEVERQEDDTVVVLHPYRRWLTYEEYSSVGKIELPTFAQAVTAAHQGRVATNGGRIGADTDLPMLQTDANQLRQYFSDPEVGGYAPGVPTPAQPPPPCGLAVPNQGSNPGLMRDCMTLLASKDTLRGTGALNWDVGRAITSWDGVTVEGAPLRVARLKLTNKSLTGSIPERLADLDALVELKLSGNSLTGCIPLPLKDVATNDLSSLNLLYCQPPAPENPTASTVGETSIQLSWDTVANASKYRVEYVPGGGGQVVTDDDTITGTTHTVDNLVCDSEYEFWVSAYGSGTEYSEAWSDAAWISESTGECMSPVFEEAEYTFEISEDASVGDAVGTVSATHPDDDAIEYSIESGNTGNAFTIGSSSGAITVNGALDYESTPNYTLTVEADDGTNTASVTVEVRVLADGS